MSQHNELFVILDSINKTKSELDLPQESFDKNAFMVNRFLSYHRDALYFSHEMSMHSDYLTGEQKYQFLKHTIDKGFRYTKYIKSNVTENVINNMMKYFKISRQKAEEDCIVLSKEQIDYFDKLYE